MQYLIGLTESVEALYWVSLGTMLQLGLFMGIPWMYYRKKSREFRIPSHIHIGRLGESWMSDEENRMHLNMLGIEIRQRRSRSRL